MQPDHQRLIDAETWAFIRRTDEYDPPDAADLSIAKQRHVHDRMCRPFFRGCPLGVVAHDTLLPHAAP